MWPDVNFVYYYMAQWKSNNNQIGSSLNADKIFQYEYEYIIIWQMSIQMHETHEIFEYEFKNI